MIEPQGKRKNARARYASNSTRMGYQFIDRAKKNTVIDREASKGKRRQHVEAPSALSKFFTPIEKRLI